MSNAGTDMASEWQRRMRSLRRGYVPPPELDVDPRLQFHSDYDSELDPITYEVVRSHFWNINWDHQDTIRRVSGSAVVVYGYDFNTSIVTEEGDGVVFGPGNLMFAGCADLVIKWTLEHRSGSIGIEPGDVFIQNDPWVGTNHQMDTAVYAPIFIDDRLFCWVYNVVHQREIGGVEPGGFVQTAQDVFSEPTFMPPLKLVSRGELREDIADMWIRRSRLPELIYLELKSQLAGVEFAQRRMRDVIDRYGPATVKGVMRRMIDDTEETVRRRLRLLPNATWRDVRYVGGSLPGDRKAHRVELRIRKDGDHLHVSNEGTEPSTGSFNITLGQMRACVVNSAIPLLAFDQYLCGAGVLKCLTFEQQDDAITSAHHPAAVSTSMGTIITITQSQHVFAKMLGASAELRQNIFAASGLHTCVLNSMFGEDQYGNVYANFPFDGVVGAIGAFPWRDGMDHGGAISSTMNPVGGVEIWEREIPFLYLYRRELPYSGGHGKWRGGATFVTGWIGHKTDDSYISSGGLYQAVTLGTGLAGAPPATGGRMWHATDTGIRKELEAGRLPGDPDELRSLADAGGPPPPKKFDNPLGVDDVFEVMPSPGAGYGDPLLRDVPLVVDDIRQGRLSRDQAESLYGIVLADTDPVTADHAATAQARDDRRAERLRESQLPATDPPDVTETVTQIGAVLETVAILETQSGRTLLGCARCEQPLSEADGNYRDGCAVRQFPLPSIDPRIYIDPQLHVDDDLVVRQFLCSSCGTSLDAVVCPAADPRDWDVALETPRDVAASERIEEQVQSAAT